MDIINNIRLKVKYISPNVVKYYKGKVYEKYLPNIIRTNKLFENNNIKGEANRWLLSMDWKVPVAGLIFSDLLNTNSKLKILEIGGSLSWFTLELLRKHHYTLIEKCFHENKTDYENIQKIVDKNFVCYDDWFNFQSQDKYDIIIANDLLPNVDQRLYEFIDKFVPITKKIRLTITYNENTFYEVKRLKSGETLYMKPWGLRNIKDFINYLYESYNITTDRDKVFSELKYRSLKGIVFENNRNILFIEMNIV